MEVSKCLGGSCSRKTGQARVTALAGVKESGTGLDGVEEET